MAFAFTGPGIAARVPEMRSARLRPRALRRALANPRSSPVPGADVGLRGPGGVSHLAHSRALRALRVSSGRGGRHSIPAATQGTKEPAGFAGNSRYAEVVSQWRIQFRGQGFDLPTGTADIGRMPDCWLVLSDDQVSRYHARVSCHGSQTTLEDRGSRNGTFVNGRRIEQPVRLQDGDKISIGRESLIVTCEVAVVESAQAANKASRVTVTSPLTSSIGLLAGLIEKSVRLGRAAEAERYATAALTQLARNQCSPESGPVEACIYSVLLLAKQSGQATWIDQVFQLYSDRDWILSENVLSETREALDRIPRIPGSGLSAYESTLRRMQAAGQRIPAALLSSIAELRDSYRED